MAGRRARRISHLFTTSDKRNPIDVDRERRESSARRKPMRFLSALAVAVVFAAAMGATGARPMAAADSLTIATLSSRADMVSGGDALVEIRTASGMPSNVSVKVNDRDATAAFHRNAERKTLIGRVERVKV